MLEFELLYKHYGSHGCHRILWCLCVNSIKFFMWNRWRMLVTSTHLFVPTPVKFGSLMASLIGVLNLTNPSGGFNAESWTSLSGLASNHGLFTETTSSLLLMDKFGGCSFCFMYSLLLSSSQKFSQLVAPLPWTFLFNSCCKKVVF